MRNKFKEINIKNRIYYFFKDIINIKNLDPNKIKINENSHKNIVIYKICSVKELSHEKNCSVNPLYLIIDKINEESNGNKYLMLVFTDKSKDTMTKHEELWNKIKSSIRSITNNSDSYDEKYMKIRFNVDNDLHLKKTLQLHEGSKYHPQLFLD